MKSAIEKMEEGNLLDLTQQEKKWFIEQAKKAEWLEEKMCQRYSIEADELYNFLGYKGNLF